MASQKERNKDLRQQLREKDKTINELNMQLNQQKLELKRVQDNHKAQIAQLDSWVVGCKKKFSKEFMWNSLSDYNDEQITHLDRTLRSMSIITGRWCGTEKDREHAKFVPEEYKC